MNPYRDNPKMFPFWYQVKEKATGKYPCSFTARSAPHAISRLESLRGQALRKTEIIAGYEPPKPKLCNAR